MSLVFLLVFLAVSLGILAGAFVWSEVRRRDELRGLKRLSNDMHKVVVREASEQLFKSVSDFELAEQPPAAADPAGFLPSGLADRGAPDVNQSVGAGPAGPYALWTAVRRFRLRDALQLADLRIKPRLFVAVCAGAAVALGALAWLLQGWLAAAPAALVGLSAPWLYLRHRLNARRNKLLRQLPAAFDMMARILRAGLSMPQAFQGVAEAFEDPLASEFARCGQEQNLGIMPEVCFRGMAERTGVLEMKIFVMAMLIQRQTGGNMAEVLERLAVLVRERLRLRNQVRTLTAEGRLQATVLLVLPLVIFLAIRAINRPYTDILLSHPEWTVSTALLMGFGALWIRKIIDID